MFLSSHKFLATYTSSPNAWRKWRIDSKKCSVESNRIKSCPIITISLLPILLSPRKCNQFVSCVQWTKNGEGLLSYNILSGLGLELIWVFYEFFAVAFFELQFAIQSIFPPETSEPKGNNGWGMIREEWVRKEKEEEKQNKFLKLFLNWSRIDFLPVIPLPLY